MVALGLGAIHSIMMGTSDIADQSKRWTLGWVGVCGLFGRDGTCIDVWVSDGVVGLVRRKGLDWDMCMGRVELFKFSSATRPRDGPEFVLLRGGFVAHGGRSIFFSVVQRGI